MSPSTTREFSFTAGDLRTLGWAAAWGVIYNMVLVMTVARQDVESLPPTLHGLVGVAMGGLAICWAAAGTWAWLINFHDHREAIGIRIAVGIVIVINGIGLIAWNSQVASPVTVVTMLTVLFPFLTWQWTGQKLSRRPLPISKHRSIRKLFEITLTLALLFASINAMVRAIGAIGDTPVIIATGLLHSVIWVMLMFTLLGRWWWAAMATLLVLALQPVAIVSLVDYRAMNADSFALLAGMMVASLFLHSVMFLLLMRSSRLRWFQHPE